jgi:hypothetical protein
MNKNMTRKGLALGAAAALAVSGLVGSPAYAAETLTLAPSAGSGYTTLAGSTFTLEAGIPSSVPGTSLAYLKFRVGNATLQAITTGFDGDGGTAGTDVTKAYGTSTNADGGGTGANVTDDDFSVAAEDADQTTNNTARMGQAPLLTLVGAHSIATSLEVTAWLDVNGNNTIDAGEDYSATQTVNFVKASLQTASAAIVAPLAGAGTLNANVTWSNSDINPQQIDAGDVLVQFGTLSGTTFTGINSYGNGTTGTTTPGASGTTTITTKSVLQSNNAGNDVVWDSVNNVYEAEFTPYDTDVAVGTTLLSTAPATTYAAKLFVDNGDNGTIDVTDAADQEGSTSSTLLGAAATNYAVKWDVTGSVNAITTQVGYETGTVVQAGYNDNTAMAASVRATATAASDFTFKVFVGTDVTVPVPIKSVPVSVTVSPGNGVTLADAVTANGLSVYTGKSRVITQNTDSAGMVSITIVGGKADADDRLDFVISVNGTQPDADVNSADGSVTFAAADYDIHTKNDLSGNGGISIISGQTFGVDYEVRDQFGQAPANGAYRVVAVDKASTNAERTTAADFAYSAPIVNGTASLVITDNGVGTGSYTLQAGWATTDAAISASNSDSVDLTVKVGTDVTASTVVMDALVYGSAQLNDANADGDYSDAGDIDKRTGLTLETNTFSQYVVNTALPSESAPSVTANIGVTLAGTVKNAAGVAVPYAPVTITAPKFMMVTNGNFVLDAVTVYADSSGKFSVVVYSQSGGVNNLVVTSGAASATTLLTYAGAVSGAAASFTITTPGASEPGRTVDVAVKVVDKNGNGVQAASVTLSSTGPGYLINTTGTTLSDGTFVTKLLLGANDSGTAVIKAVMTIDAVQVIKTSSIVVGVGAVASSDRKITVGTYKGYVAVFTKGYAGQKLSVRLASKWHVSDPIVDLKAGYSLLTVNTGVGYVANVIVYIDGVEVERMTITTK